jgi:hypothetical protein
MIIPREGEWLGWFVETESGGCASDAGADDGDTRWIVLALLRRRGLWASEGADYHPR